MKANEIRANFWNSFPQFKSDYKRGKTQNDYCCDIRCSFVDYVDYLLKNGDITEKQANNTTL